MKNMCLVDNATTVWSPDLVERAHLGMILGVFWPIQVVFVIGGHFVM